MQREMLQMIDTHADRLYDVLNTLLDVWRLDSGAQTLQLSQVQIPELLRQVVEHWQRAAPRHTFVLTIPPVVPRVVVCDAVRVGQALHSLLNNAVTYSPEGGTITILLENNDVEVRLSITDERAGDVASIGHVGAVCPASRLPAEFPALRRTARAPIGMPIFAA